MPRKIDTLFEEYEQSHQDPTNVAIHWVFEPLAVWGVLAIIHHMAFPFEGTVILVTLILLLYFALLSFRITICLSIIAVVFLLSISVLSNFLSTDLIYVAVPTFVVSWIALIIGHRIEGNWPSVFNNPHLIFIGPAWLVARLYKKYGIKY